MLIDAAKGVEPQTQKAVRDLPRAPHPAVHVHEQDGPAEPRSARAARRTRERARDRRVSDELAARQRRRRSAASTTAQRAKVHLFERTAHGAKRAPVGHRDPSRPAASRALVDERTYRAVPRRHRTARRRRRSVRPRGDAARRRDAGLLRQRGDQLRRRSCSSTRSSRWPPPRRASTREAARRTDRCKRFTGFVFKIQANMDPRHRDRIAFVRVCSGKFERDMTVRNVRTGKGRAAHARDEALRRRPRIGRRRVRRRRRRPGQPRRLRDRRHALRRRPRRLRPDSGLRAGTFRTGAQYRHRRATSRSKKGSRSCARRARFRSSIHRERRGSNRSWPPSARCSSRS